MFGIGSCTLLSLCINDIGYSRKCHKNGEVHLCADDVIAYGISKLVDHGMNKLNLLPREPNTLYQENKMAINT